ncbi:dephospho-CoA kinase [Malassezia cuniculi]|uniref:Dephospho-CoA kinase n=1 Tax=Malassezia cuniculi TaxID=948313 RepID=A0AAF0EVW6_9BASI|nr:dephospho-CoA kinase [Malassezia cuniculi]
MISIASGKSTASRAFKANNVPVIDLDVIAREVVEPGKPTLRRLAETFGSDIIKDDGSLDRAELGRRAFADKEQTKKLNKITHTAIRKCMAWRLVKLWLSGHRRVVVDTPLLIEAGLYKYCALVVIVWANEKQQLQRMLLRDADKGLTEEDARARLAAQKPLSEKLPLADVVIDNERDSADGSAVAAQVGQLVAEWRKGDSTILQTTLWLLSWLCPPFGLLYGAAVLRWRARRARKNA